MSGFVFYDGPSLIDGAPIVAIAVLESENGKTGDMVQTYILRADVDPVSALRTGEDASICGDCVHRPANDGAAAIIHFVYTNHIQTCKPQHRASIPTLRVLDRA